ncbi:MAG: AAA family ATPase [Bacteroidota bacterium]
MEDAIQSLSAHIESLRPIIYITHFDTYAVDKYIKSLGLPNIHEYNDAQGSIDFFTKQQEKEISLEDFLSSFDIETLDNTILVLKDIHHHLDNPEIISRLKRLALKHFYDDDYYLSIFIVSTHLHIPEELEKMVTVFNIPLPDTSQTKELIIKFSEDLGFEIEPKLAEKLAWSCKGLSEFEIIQVLNQAYHYGGMFHSTDHKLIIEEKHKIISRMPMLEIVEGNESMKDVGGQEILKEWIRKKSNIFRRLDEALEFGLDAPKGVFIAGIPGCGKSLITKATADLFNVPLLKLEISQLSGKFFWEKEMELQKALRTTEAISPCILWLDEIDRSFSDISKFGDSNDHLKLFRIILEWMHEKKNQVFTILTCSDISVIPSDFFRKGNFDARYFIDLPNDYERAKIFEIHLYKRKQWHEDLDLIPLIECSHGFSCADIVGSIMEAMEHVFLDGRNYLTTEDLLKVMNNHRPLLETMPEKIDTQRKYRNLWGIRPASDDSEISNGNDPIHVPEEDDPNSTTIIENQELIFKSEDDPFKNEDPKPEVWPGDGEAITENEPEGIIKEEPKIEAPLVDEPLVDDSYPNEPHTEEPISQEPPISEPVLSEVVSEPIKSEPEVAQTPDLPEPAPVVETPTPAYGTPVPELNTNGQTPEFEDYPPILSEEPYKEMPVVPQPETTPATPAPQPQSQETATDDGFDEFDDFEDDFIDGDLDFDDFEDEFKEDNPYSLSPS